MKELKEISVQEEQKIQLQILKIFKKCCENEKIQYFAGYGTLLGAVREKGFIEWDDDIDIWMKRKDVVKFIEVFYRYFDEKKYFLQTYKTDRYCLSPEMIRICVNNTYKWDENARKEKFHTGIYFDIFPLDYAFGNDKDIYYLKKFTKYHTNLYNNLKRKWFALSLKEKIKYVVYHKTSRKRLIRKVRKVVSIYSENQKGSQFVCLPTSYFGYDRSCFNVEDFSTNVMLKFEDTQISCPIGYKKLLSTLYGDDYMTPKVTKADRHKAYIWENGEENL